VTVMLSKIGLSYFNVLLHDSVSKRLGISALGVFYVIALYKSTFTYLLTT